MADRRREDQLVVDRQAEVLRIAKDRGLSRALLSARSGIPAPTLASYEQDTAMPLFAFVQLAKVLPADLASLLIEDSGHRLCPIEEAAADWLRVGERAATFASKVCRYQATGGFIDHTEAADLAREGLMLIAETTGAVGKN